jgi:putative transposase
MVIERRFETVWEVPDVLWERIEPVLLEADPPNPRGRPRADARRALDGIIFRLRSGCQWNRLPKEFGDDSTIHRTFQRWVDRGVFTRIWALLVQKCEDLGEVQWRWQSADAAMGKARLGGSYWTQSNGPGQGREQAKHPG